MMRDFHKSRGSARWPQRRVLPRWVATCLGMSLLLVAGCSASDEQQALATISQLGGKIKNDSQGHVVEVDLSRTPAGDAEVAMLQVFPQLGTLNLSHTRINGQGLVTLGGLSELRVLYLVGTEVDDAGASFLRNLKSLETLHLGRTKITDQGLVALEDLQNLRTLALGNTAVSDAGLAHLRNLRGLATLAVRHTKVTPGGVQELRRSLPTTQIDR